MDDEIIFSKKRKTIHKRTYETKHLDHLRSTILRMYPSLNNRSLSLDIHDELYEKYIHKPSDESIQLLYQIPNTIWNNHIFIYFQPTEMYIMKHTCKYFRRLINAIIQWIPLSALLKYLGL